MIGYVGQNMLLPHMVEATITLERKATNEVFGYRSHCRMIHSTQGITAAWYAGYVGDVTHGSALRLAALQLSFSNAAVMGNGSWVKVRWLGDSAAIPATNAIADAPNDAFVYMRGQNAWKSGGTLSGDLTISKAGPYLFLNKAASGQSSVIWGQTAAKNRWSIELGHAAGEGGSNSGSDFVVARWDDAGAYINQPLVISRATGDATFSGFIGIGCAPTAYPGAGNTTVGCNVLPTGQLFASTAANPPIYANVNVDGWLASLSRAGVAKGSISVSATAVAFNTTSDGRLKEDRKAFDAGPLIDATNVYDFLWKDTTTRGYGVVAQEAIAVLPDAVNHNEEQDSWGVDYSKYVPLLLQEVKALRARVAELEAA
ncbi:MAG: tail fiber domain-containing protein [Vicinamibacterales bacterium]